MTQTGTGLDLPTVVCSVLLQDVCSDAAHLDGADSVLLSLRFWGPKLLRRYCWVSWQREPEPQSPGQNQNWRSVECD